MVASQKLRKSAVFAGRSMLLVDDDKIMRDTLKAIVLQLGFEKVDEAEDGSSALRMLDVNRYDLILTDIMMQPMDGLEMARILRNSANVRFDTLKTTTKIVFMTASDDTSNIQVAKGLKVQGYVLKPVDPHLLRAKLLKVFGA